MIYKTLLQMKKTLGQLDTWLEASEAHAKAKSFDSGLFLAFRLAPDQFPFARQVQVTCDTAKLAASRLSGKDAPSHPDTEETIEALRARARSVIAYLNAFSEKDFADGLTRSVTQPRWEGKSMTGEAYFLEHAIPNFFFHSTTAYAILRHNGVNLGKKDFLGQLTFKSS
jgi:uncharacterized protein